jgi:XTP/dITP diphosphohydrolase
VALASRNDHKVREIQDICAGWPVTWVTFRDASWEEVEETGSTYVDNARLKGQAVSRTLGIRALADDSGIEVDALGGGPGPLSARFAGPTATDRENLGLLIDRIRSVPEAERTARYRCVALLVRPDGAEWWAEGVCEGGLVLEPRGSGGFGYDPIFVPRDEPGRTMAELSTVEKHAISHRGRAFRALRIVLEDAGELSGK